MNGVDVYGRYGNVVSSMSGLEVINNNVNIMLDPNPNNDLSISSNGLLGNGLLTSGTNSMKGNLNMGSNNIINVATPINPTDGCNKQYVDSVFSNLIGSVVNSISTARTTMTLTKPLTNTTKVFMNVFYNNFTQYGSNSFLLSARSLLKDIKCL